MFNQFATNDDGTMSIEDMRNFIRHCGAGEYAASITRVKHIFMVHCQSEDKFTCDGFLDFYKTAIEDRPFHVLSDLAILGHGEDISNGIDGEHINAIFNDFVPNQSDQNVDFNIIFDENDNRLAINVTHIAVDTK